MADSDYLFVLAAVKELPFNVGKKLLIDFLRGDESNNSVMNNSLFELENFGALAYEKEELDALIEDLLGQGFLGYDFVQGKKFWKIIEITKKGKEELINPSLFKNKTKLKEVIFSDKEKALILSFGDFLSEFNDAQKKAIISRIKNILCVAGAGSGKTTVLTKRIEFLVKYNSVNPENILAITFTRKARTQMLQKLAKLGIHNCKVETFNSYCEKVLNKYESKIYDKPTRVTTYKDKIVAINKALVVLETDMSKAIDVYFSDGQIKNKSKEQLARTFMNDCFFVRDYLKSKNENIQDIKHDKYLVSKDSFELIYGVTKFIDAYMKKNGLRDFMDQLLDTLELYKSNPKLIPKFEHILVDEFQDVNSLQVEFLDLLKKNNLFCVGDPRQSIFGWRGSDIKFINEFEEKYDESETIMLTTNYRSDEKIVKIMNKEIKKMNLPDLKSEISGENKVALIGFENEITEFEFIAQSILSSESKRDEIFVLSRMNKQLNELSDFFKLKEIPHILKNDDAVSDIQEHKGKVVLATVHSIKGLEAETVYVTGCTSLYFPCKGSEHPFLEMIKVDEYDKEEEERRLFYVAISRAKKNLILSYTGKYPTYFITKEMKDELNYSKPNKKSDANIHFKTQSNIVDRLKEWRKNKAEELGTKAFLIMHDSTLLEIADKKPLSLEELRQIKGLAANKLSKFGEELLDQIY
ncbi:UvrD-helicase domain-containing protein [Candidatus Woesearchaeota archaeon]|nr:UvrD-helicase domain-containing protein [Candidatus Woesearchaeota archaeon]MCF7901242.1 UvrD-helicase domain-containing protein [Candidatus Woesearchaeota archaeon]MCF8012851.1 UvrD-helicase domain-containing protein [Candidatus Woesearchaeota archaeon]